MGRVIPLFWGLERVTYLSRLSLTNFRNFVQLELDLPRGVVVFFGSNAQGKTTLMEAVYLLAIARSFHAANRGSNCTRSPRYAGTTLVR